MQDVVLRPGEFVALVNQTLDYAYGHVVIEGELANFRVSKNRWVYFNLKDEYASVKCFGTIYQLPGPLEDGMMLKVSGNPRLHPQYGFSVTIQSLAPSGEGTIKKAAALLEAKLEKEGLFDIERKRRLPYPPQRIGLIASGESAAYSDFMKILNARWHGVEVLHYDVQVQGEAAIEQIQRAVDYFNNHAQAETDVIVVTRGGGSPDDLAAFSAEQVVRSIAASRTPTLLAIGHERDISLAERAADVHASTPSNAAELLVPDAKEQRRVLKQYALQLANLSEALLVRNREQITRSRELLSASMQQALEAESRALANKRDILLLLDPEAVLRRGYAIVRHDNHAVHKSSEIKKGHALDITFAEGKARATVDEVK